ncbi:MAG: hypothetical protein BPH43C_54 [Phage 5P_1]|nr:MAG: hypothetical protein BPH43C_54 [Phage 5P_1]
MIGGAYHIFEFTERDNKVFDGYADRSIKISHQLIKPSYIKIVSSETDEEFTMKISGLNGTQEIEEDVLIEGACAVTSVNEFTELTSITINDFDKLTSIPYLVISAVDVNGLPLYWMEHELYYGRYAMITSNQTAIDIFSRGQEFRQLIKCVLDGEVPCQKGQTFRIAGQYDTYVILTDPRYRFRLGTDTIEHTEFFAGVNYDAPQVV